MSRYWAQRLQVRAGLAYGQGLPGQSLDLYLLGQAIGEPSWFRLPEEPSPVVLYIHGGGWMDGDARSREPMFLPLLERGWSVVAMDYRKGPGTGPAAIEDSVAALSWIGERAAELHFDPSRVVLAGESAGGHLALMAAFANGAARRGAPENTPWVRAVINWFGVSDLRMKDRQARKEGLADHSARRWAGPLSERELDEFFISWSPLSHVSRHSPPVLSIHGTADTLVNVEQSLALDEAMKNSGAIHKLHLVEGANHGGFTDAQWSQAWDLVFDFLSLHVPKSPGLREAATGKP